ncbi:MAG: sulfatase-like hydrolase/transferase, partial [Phycisphaeraceae bacterium]|nr:sulfatase-like hydrolase/transferase [Phycisphaeraceae bacterium]
VWFGSPHEPYSGLPADLKRYDHLPEKYKDRGTVSLTSNKTGRRVKRPLGDVLRERYAEITAMDRSIGTLRDFLKKEGLRDNTLLWYCGDNGTPPSGLLASPLRGRKGQFHEGGIRVPAVMEWPARISKPRISTVNTVTSDILPTLCALAGTQMPDNRPLDGVSLVPLLEGVMDKRNVPIFFWGFNQGRRLKAKPNPKPWIDPHLQKGTTPLVKLRGNIATRNFRNDRHPDIIESDFSGTRVILNNRYKLIIHDDKGGQKIELFEIRRDPAESKNLAAQEVAITKSMQADLHTWQESVLRSLTGADYK